MSSVGEEQAGVASGINNAVSRTAGLLAIAVFGVVMLQAFSKTLASRMNEIQLDDQVKHSVYEQRVKLAGLEIPPNADPSTQEKFFRESSLGKPKKQRNEPDQHKSADGDGCTQ